MMMTMTGVTTRTMQQQVWQRFQPWAARLLAQLLLTMMMMTGSRLLVDSKRTLARVGG
jgi:hypothetical protein